MPEGWATLNDEETVHEEEEHAELWEDFAKGLGTEIKPAQITETKKRLPAHSVKPPVMMDLLALEDEYDELLKQIEELKQKENT